MGRSLEGKACDDEKSDLQILQILQNVHLAKPDRTVALCLQRPNSWAFVCEMGLEFINKSSIRSDMMWFDFVHKFSNQSEKMYVIQPNLTSFDPVICVFGWDAGAAAGLSIRLGSVAQALGLKLLPPPSPLPNCAGTRDREIFIICFSTSILKGYEHNF